MTLQCPGCSRFQRRKYVIFNKGLLHTNSIGEENIDYKRYEITLKALLVERKNN